MLKLSTKMIVIVSLLFVVLTVSTPKAEAMEPISLALMAAPIVLPIVKAMVPHVVKGIANFAGGMVEVFVDMAGICLIPIGMFESSIGAPFGLFYSGLSHIGKGFLAPFKMTWSTMMLPIKIFTG